MKIFLYLDPAYLNLKQALKGTSAVIICFILGSRLSPLMGFLGGLLALLASILVTDVSRKAQMVTTFWMMPVAAACLVPSILLSSYPNAQRAIFLIITFLAVYLRKFGMRWLSLGMVGFMSYFLPLFFPMKSEKVSNVLLTIIFSISCTFLLRYFFLPDKEDATLKRLLKAWNRCYQILAECLKKGVQPSFTKLNALTLLIEKHCNTSEHPLIQGRAEALQLALFDRERDLQFLKLEHFTPIMMDEMTSEDIKRSAETAPSLSIDSVFLNSTTKLAIQAAIAVAIASYLGILLSDQRWYWAPMAAFMTLTGTSRGETLVRACMRVSGTLLGLICGILVGPLITGNPNLEWTLIIVSIFLGMFGMKFYFGLWSASIFTFMLTVLLRLMGQFTDEVLILRFEETLLGAGLGAIVSALVLPTSTSKVIREAITKTLKSQAAVLALLPLKRNDRLLKRDLVKAIRKMEQDLVAVRALAVPYTGKLSFMRRKEISSIVHHVTFLTHYVKKLAADEGTYLSHSEKGLERTRQFLLEVADHLEDQLYNKDSLAKLGNIQQLMEEV